MESSRIDAPIKDFDEGGRPTTSIDINIQHRSQNPQSSGTGAGDGTTSHQSPVISQEGGNSYFLILFFNYFALKSRSQNLQFIFYKHYFISLN